MIVLPPVVAEMVPAIAGAVIAAGGFGLAQFTSWKRRSAKANSAKGATRDVFGGARFTSDGGIRSDGGARAGGVETGVIYPGQSIIGTVIAGKGAKAAAKAQGIVYRVDRKPDLD